MIESVVVSKYPDLVRVSSVEPLDGRRVRVSFTDGSQREIDLRPYLEGPIFERIRRNDDAFRQISIDHGALAWPNGADIDPDTLYYDGAPPWAADEPAAERIRARQG